MPICPYARMPIMPTWKQHISKRGFPINVWHVKKFLWHLWRAGKARQGQCANVRIMWGFAANCHYLAWHLHCTGVLWYWHSLNVTNITFCDYLTWHQPTAKIYDIELTEYERCEQNLCTQAPCSVIEPILTLSSVTEEEILYSIDTIQKVQMLLLPCSLYAFLRHILSYFSFLRYSARQDQVVYFLSLTTHI